MSRLKPGCPDRVLSRVRGAHLSSKYIALAQPYVVQISGRHPIDKNGPDLKKMSSTSDAPSRHEALESSIRHLTRLLEAERAALYVPNPAPSAVSHATGLTALMARDKALPPQILAPYEVFSEGVRVGYENNKDLTWVVLDFTPANDAEIEVKRAPRRMPRLRLNPVFSKEHKSRWITLEVALHDLNLQDAEALTVSLLSDFDFKDKTEALHTNVVRMVLRAESTSERYEELDIGFFPIMTMPRSHMLIMKNSRFDLKRMGAAAQYRLLIHLPVYGDYTFNLYDLSVVTA